MIQQILAIWSLIPLPFLKPAWTIWQFTVQILLKSGLENFKHFFTRVWDECNCIPYYYLIFPWHFSLISHPFFFLTKEVLTNFIITNSPSGHLLWLLLRLMDTEVTTGLFLKLLSSLFDFTNRRKPRRHKNEYYIFYELKGLINMKNRVLVWKTFPLPMRNKDKKHSNCFNSWPWKLPSFYKWRNKTLFIEMWMGRNNDFTPLDVSM